MLTTSAKGFADTKSRTLEGGDRFKKAKVNQKSRRKQRWPSEFLRGVKDSGLAELLRYSLNNNMSRDFYAVSKR
eukprot:972721-Amphidinium_carterae.1